MCEFASWVEKKENNHQKIYYLTYAQMHDARGKAIQECFPGQGELLGHAAIRPTMSLKGVMTRNALTSVPLTTSLLLLSRLSNGAI